MTSIPLKYIEDSSKFISSASHSGSRESISNLAEYDKEPKNKSKSEPNHDSKGFTWTEYNDFESIIAFLYEMRKKFFEIVKIINIGKSFEGRPILVLRIASHKGPYVDKIFIEGGIHAREWISPAVVTYMIHRLLHRWRTLPKFMRNKVWLFLPILNPDGYVYSWTTDRLWRKNRSKQANTNCAGVDLNRNFPVGWDKNNHTDPCHLNYKGEKPFSESETKALRDFLIPQRKHLKAYISFHSFGQEIRYLWNFKLPVKREERVTEIAKRGAENMRLTTGERYKVLGRYATKSMFGNSRDWARKILGIDYSYLVELRDKGDEGFLLPVKQIKSTAIEAFEFIQTVASAITEDRVKSVNYTLKLD